MSYSYFFFMLAYSLSVFAYVQHFDFATSALCYIHHHHRSGLYQTLPSTAETVCVETVGDHLTTGRTENPPEGIIHGHPLTNGDKAAYKEHRILWKGKYVYEDKAD